MMHFTVSDALPISSGCTTCCCEQITAKPGTINKVGIGYAPWAVPIGQLHCTPQFELLQLETCPDPIGGDLPPTIVALDGMARFDTGTNVTLTADLKTKIADPEGRLCVFKVLPMYGPKHGKLNLLADGFFTYAPCMNFTGEERFYISASDGVNPPVNFEVMIAVGIDAGIMVPTPHVSIDPDGIRVNQQYFIVTFPIKVSPAAKVCEVWRLNVLQAALDCDCICFTRIDCYDIKVAKC